MNSVVSVIIIKSFENVNNFNGFYPHRLNTDADTKAEYYVSWENFDIMLQLYSS